MGTTESKYQTTYKKVVSNRALKKDFLCIVSVFALSSALFALITQNSSITDVDSIHYLEGAYSLQSSGKYTDLNGNFITHWPLGYSVLLSFFPNPIVASHWINSIAFGATLSFLWKLGRLSHWNNPSIIGFILSLGSGFFRIVAEPAKPDILTYALFLLSLLLFLSNDSLNRSASYIILALLIPFKLISIVFIPSFLVSLALSKRRDLFSYDFLAEIALGFIPWILAIGFVVYFNKLSAGYTIPSSHASPTASVYLSNIYELLNSIWREYIASWYGSLRSPRIAFPFFVVLAAGIASFLTLRQDSRNALQLHIGLCCIIFSLAMLAYRDFHAGMRLLGYGFFPALLALRPIPRHKYIWIIYGLLSFSLMLYNTRVVNSDGLNNTRYFKASSEVYSAIKTHNGRIFSNSDNLIDVLHRLPTSQIYSSREIDNPGPGDIIVNFKLANIDGIMTPISPLIEVPADQWQTVMSGRHATIYERR